MNWPKTLKAFRKKHGLSQGDLAKRLHVSIRTVKSWEYRMRTPHPYLTWALMGLENYFNSDVYKKVEKNDD